MKKQITFDKEARDKIKIGVNVLADAVSATMGARGKNVVIQKQTGTPIVTKDGVTVAKEVYMDDAVENLGAQMLKEVALNTNRDAGDGTTTATVLARAIYNNGLKHLDNGYNAILVKRGMDMAVDKVVNTLRSMAEVVNQDDKIAQIATISANNDKELGKLIAEAISTVGLDGIVTVDKSKTENTYIDKVDGIQFNRGYLSPYFINNMTKASCDLNDKPHVLVFDGAIKDITAIMSVLEFVATQKDSLLIICDEISNEVLSGLIYNKMQNTLNVVVVKAPAYGDFKHDLMGDIAVITGATHINPEAGFNMASLSPDHLGRCQTVIVDKVNTTIVNGSGSESEVNERVEQLKEEMKSVEQFKRDRLQQRVANLLGGVAVINVGGSSEVEIEEKKYRIDDALNATRAGIEEGIVAGGGVALLNCVKALDELVFHNEDERVGIDIIRESIQAPISTIIENGGDKSDYIVKTILNQDNKHFGYNILTNKFENLIETGIIDPVKVTRLALTNANSVASMMLTTQVVIVDLPEDKSNH